MKMGINQEHYYNISVVAGQAKKTLSHMNVIVLNSLARLYHKTLLFGFSGSNLLYYRLLCVSNDFFEGPLPRFAA